MQDRGDELVRGARAHAQHALLPRQVAQHRADLRVVGQAIAVVRCPGVGFGIGFGIGIGAGLGWPGGVVLVHRFTQHLEGLEAAFGWAARRAAADQPGAAGGTGLPGARRMLSARTIGRQDR
ncbi:protein of unknown function (plasmid) [Cupriavidus taiwanensis]|nr:protein of unknown function [Cupriavidus taiwanensis]SPD55856.1 protein of unknown function [Cupriavidus taiwanensis]